VRAVLSDNHKLADVGERGEKDRRESYSYSSKYRLA
jgi:hypothetical protein